MVPFHSFHDFLDSDLVTRLLEYALSNEAKFTPSTVGKGTGNVDDSKRLSRRLRDLGALERELAERVLAMLPMLIEELSVNAFESAGVEVELVAHGDGAFYKQHIDTGLGEDYRNRMISGVYYFNSEPKAFSGGALRLYDLGPAGFSEFVDIEPIHNTFVAFPSWMPHEVLPIRCPSRRFIDSRFAVNCWLLRKKPDVASGGNLLEAGSS